jgi:hypothetical protein
MAYDLSNKTKPERLLSPSCAPYKLSTATRLGYQLAYYTLVVPYRAISSVWERIQPYLCSSTSQITSRSTSSIDSLPTINSANFSAIKKPPIHFDHINREKAKLKEFVREKANKFGIRCVLLSTSVSEPDMRARTSKDYDGWGEIIINPLHLLGERDLNFFFDQFPVHKESVNQFCSQLDPNLLNEAADHLIESYNTSVTQGQKIPKNDETIATAKIILVMHAKGIISQSKRFSLIHELGHIYDRNKTTSLGNFDANKFSFIRPHQYHEMRADLTAARELQAHAVGAYLNKVSHVIAGESDESDPHPTYLNRARALELDASHRIF